MDFSSTQSFAPVSRLLWKEYRSQRAFWFAMLLMGLAPQFLFRLLISDAGARINSIWCIAAAAPLLFIVGSMSILFAGEREERTSDWLVQLSVSPFWLLLAKWGFMLISALALMVALSVAAVAMVWELPSSPRQSDSMTGMTLTLWCFAGFVLWGSLGSLLSRRVVTAIPAMVFWWVMTLIVPVIWLPALLDSRMPGPAFYRYQEILCVLSFVLVGAADLWLGWRWCQGKYLDATKLDDLHSRVVQAFDVVTRRQRPRSRLPARVEFSNPWRREWQRLLWQERRRESYHRALFYIGCALGPFLAMLGVWHRSDLMNSILPMLAVYPLVMGILGFRFDGEGQPLRFLANRGVSAHVLWLVKHVTWFPRAFWIPGLVWLLAVVLESLFLTNRQAIGSLHRTTADAWSHASIVTWFVILTYGCGHLCAMILRRTVLAIAVTVGCCVIAVQWLSLMVTLQVPLWWSVGGVCAWIFGISWWLAPGWLMESRPLRRWSRWTAALIIPPLTLVGLVAAWRVFEVWNISLAPELAAEIDRQSKPITGREQQLLDQLAATIGGFNIATDFDPTRNTPDTDPAERRRLAAEHFWANNESRLNELLEITRAERGTSPRRYLELSGSSDGTPSRNLLPQQQLLLEAARLRTEEGRLSDALNYYCAGMRLASYWATGCGVVTRWQAERQQLYTLQSLITWADHPDQTGSALRSAVRRIQIEIALFPPMRETLVAEYRQELAELKSVIKYGPMSPPDQAGYGWVAGVLDVSRYLPWEQTRAELLLMNNLTALDHEAVNFRAMITKPGVDATELMEWTHSLFTAVKDDAIRTTFLLQRKQWTNHSLPFLVAEREVATREALLALSLMAWKLDHQKWPAELGEVLALDRSVLPPVVACDPWNGEPFHYQGSLINRQEDTSGRWVLLSTVGPNQLRDVYAHDAGQAQATSPVGLPLQIKDWRGSAARYDDRLKIEVVDGKVVMQLPNTFRYPEPARHPD